MPLCQPCFLLALPLTPQRLVLQAHRVFRLGYSALDVLGLTNHLTLNVMHCTQDGARSMRAPPIAKTAQTQSLQQPILAHHSFGEETVPYKGSAVAIYPCRVLVKHGADRPPTRLSPDPFPYLPRPPPPNNTLVVASR